MEHNYIYTNIVLFVEKKKCDLQQFLKKTIIVREMRRYFKHHLSRLRRYQHLQGFGKHTDLR